MSILAGLENLEKFNNEPNEEALTDVDMTFVLESYITISDEVAEIEEMIAVNDEAVETCTNLENLAEVIEEHGISRPVMLAADPSRSLEAYGIVPAYEGLEENVVKDSNAAASLEGLVDTMKKAWKKIIEFIKSIGRKIKELFGKMKGLFQKKFEAATKVLNELKDADLDTEAAKDKEITYFKDASKIDLRKVLASVETVVNSLKKYHGIFKSGVTKNDAASLTSLATAMESEIKQIKDDFAKNASGSGIVEVTLKDSDVAFKIKVKTDSTKLTKVDKNQLMKILEQYLYTKGYMDIAKSSTDIIEDTNATLKKLTDAIKDDDVAKAANKVVKQAQKMSSFINTIITGTAGSIDKVGSVAISAGRSYLSYKKN